MIELIDRYVTITTLANKNSKHKYDYDKSINLLPL